MSVSLHPKAITYGFVVFFSSNLFNIFHSHVLLYLVIYIFFILLQNRKKAKLKQKPGTSLVVQCLRLHACNAGCLGSIPGQQTKIPYAVQCGQNKKRGPQNYADHWQMPCCRSVEKPLKVSYGHGVPSCKFRYLFLTPFTVSEC